MFYYSQTSVIFLYNGGILVDYRAYKPYTLVRPPVRRSVLDPLAAYTSTTIYKLQITLLHDIDLLWAAFMYCINTCLYDMWVGTPSNTISC